MRLRYRRGGSATFPERWGDLSILRWFIRHLAEGRQKVDLRTNERCEMPKAIVNGQIVAESDEFEVVEGRIYFPQSVVKTELFIDSRSRTNCHWKGSASYYDVLVDGETLRNAA
jgi:uncharacterized protein (DUF427 family)